MSALAAVESAYVGLVRNVVDVLAAPDDARLFQRLAIGATSDRLGSARLSTEFGGGYSADPERARLAAIGEAVERYSAAAFIPEEDLVLASAAELGPEAVSPSRFALFAPEQHARPDFPFASFTMRTRVRWVRAVRLPDRVPAYLPAQLVYLPPPRPELGESPIGYSTSNGLACGTTADSALVAAAFELLERDAFLIAWTARLALPRLDWSSCRELAAYARRRLEPTGLRLETVDLSCVHDVPTVLALVHADGRSGGELGVGAAAASTVEDAWLKAVAEAFAVRSAARSLLRRKPDRCFAPDFADVETFEDHIHLYALRRHAPRAAFLESSPVLRDTAAVTPLAGETPEQLLAVLVERLARHGLELFVVDVTAPDVREAGLHVMRAVVPELCPLDVRHDARFLGAARLREVPCELGFTPQPLTFAELNPDPHPFP